MQGALGLLMLFLLLAPATAAAGFRVSLPPGSAVRVGSPSPLSFTVTNTDAGGGLSRLQLRFPPGYQVRAGSLPPGWQGAVVGAESGEVRFGTTDETGCAGAIPAGTSLIFAVEVVAPASGSAAPDRLERARAERSCEGVALEDPGELPSWQRLGIRASLAAGPEVVGLGGDVWVTLTVDNLSTVTLADVSALLGVTGTASVSDLRGPSPQTLSLAPGASGRLTWTARAVSAGSLAFQGQALSGRLSSPPVRSDPVQVADLEVGLSVAPAEVRSGQEVTVEMTAAAASAGTGTASETTAATGGDSTASTADGTTATGTTAESPSTASTSGTESPTGSEEQTTGSSDQEGGTTSVADTGGTSGPAPAAMAGQGRDGERGRGRGRRQGGGEDEEEQSTPPPEVVVAPSSLLPPPPSAALQLIGVDHNGTPTGGTAFSGGGLRDLWIVVAWSDLAGPHTQRLELRSPDGSLYQRLTTRVQGASSVQARLPVGGTWITEYRLFGAWQVDVFLDRSVSPTASATFLLTP